MKFRNIIPFLAGMFGAAHKASAGPEMEIRPVSKHPTLSAATGTMPSAGWRSSGIPHPGRLPNQRQRRKARRRAWAAGYKHAFGR